METNPLRKFFDIPLDRPEFSTAERRLYRASTAFLIYTPIMMGFNAVGLTLIFIIAYLGLLDNPDPKLLILAGVSVLFALIHLPLFSYAKRGHLELVITGLLTTSMLSGIAQVFFWGGGTWGNIIILFPVSLIVIPIFTFLYLRNIRNSYRILGALSGILALGIVIYLDQSIKLGGAIPYERMDFSSLSQIAGFTLFILVTTTLVIISLFRGVIPFSSITYRLVSTFAYVAVLAAIFILVISSLSSFFQDRQSAINQLETVSNFKQIQIESTLSNFEHDTSLILQNEAVTDGINALLSTPESNSSLYENNYNIVLSLLQTLQVSNSQFNEILLLDTNGKAIISTVEGNRNKDFSKNIFFRQIFNGQTLFLENQFPNTKQNSLSILAVKPILKDGKTLGVLVIRSNLNEIINSAETNTDLNNKINTYLVASINGKDIAVTAKDESIIQNIDAIKQAIAKNKDAGWGIYNKQGNDVLTHYALVSKIGIAIITEIEVSKIMQSAINLLTTNIIVGLFTVALAFTIIYVTSQSISNPIINLAQKANALATGEMSTRITIDRDDEIGRLSSSFNVMAEQLQNLVRTLEEKVEDRTQGLQIQANRLLLASEIARDAATLGDLDQLLEHTSRLVLDRFHFYHTGIFLIDQQREYAILRASPTQAGQEMIKENYRLKIGKEGIVGNVAITGNATVIADTTTDTTLYINNPLLPQTRSEAAIPLKVEARVIGVLDVQSETAHIFSQDDIVVLQIMADQLALAIERVQLVEQLENRLSELEHAYQQFTLTSWQNFSRQPDFKAGYNFDGVKISAINSFPLWSQDALRRGRPVILPGKTTDSKDSFLAVPLKLRGQIIGVLSIRFTGDVINQEDISLSEEIANRLAVALENARLYTETQKLAQQERSVSDISTRITASINIENILRTAVQELGRMLPEAEITVQLQQEKEE